MSAPYRIQTGTRDVSGDSQLKSYLERLMKLIPAEVVGLYLAGSGIVPKDQAVGLVIWAVICLAGVILIRAYGTADAALNLKTDWVHVGISSISFVIWIYSIGGPFTAYNLSVPWIASLLMLAWVFFIPYIYKGPMD